jgi:hypothetical protein
METDVRAKAKAGKKARPGDKAVLAYLNAVQTTEELQAALGGRGGAGLAERLLQRRASLGGFRKTDELRDLVGHEAEELMKDLGERAKRLSPYEIEGRIVTTQEIDFGAAKLGVAALVDGVEVGRAPVKSNGTYLIAYEHRSTPSRVQLKVIPFEGEYDLRSLPTVSAEVVPKRFREYRDVHKASLDIALSATLADYLERLGRHVTYNVSGVVNRDDSPESCPGSDLKALPGARVDFYSVNVAGTPVKYLASGYSASDGSYAISFEHHEWTFLQVVWGTSYRPDVLARVFVLRDGAWNEVYVTQVRWDITTTTNFTINVPGEALGPLLPEEAKPITGFRYTRVGHLPIDTGRIVEGYATSQSDDPISLNHQPFCGRLRFHGLFGDGGPAITSYTVELADATTAVPIESTWRFVTDPLTNGKYDEGTHRWVPTNLGPGDDHHYRNIDIEPEIDWTEHALKVSWQTTNVPDGYYALRITGYAGTTPIQAVQTPVLRIDNTVPTAVLEAKGLGPCGGVTLPTSGGDITFTITAYNPNGHLGGYSLTATRGANPAEGAGAEKDDPADPVHSHETRPASGVWNGLNAKDKIFVVSHSDRLASCPAVAYGFILNVWGTATDCEGSGIWAPPQYANLVVFPA